MADVNISKYRASVVRDGSKPASPGFVVSEGQDPVNPPGTNNFVPYTGATANVELGEYGLESGFVTLDTTPTNTPTDQGTIYWDDTRSTAALIMNGTLQHIGQDSFFYVKNSSGSTIPKGTCVGFAGTDGASGHLLVTPFLANGSVPSTYFMGVTSEEIANGSFGQVMHFGELDGINTSGFTAGALLYASTTVAGGFQTNVPVAPNNIILVAAAVNSKNNGAIVVRPTLGSNINSDEGVKITSPTTGDLLQLQAGGLWENKTKAQILGGTSSQFVKGDGSLDSTSYQPLLTNPVTGTGVSGQVAFWNGTNSQTGDNGLFWDNTNKRLGIGTTTPTVRLDVSTTSGENYIRVNSAANQDSGYRIAEGGTNKWLLYNVAASDAFAIYDNTAVAERLRITSSGNVLIGTTTDAGYKLNVAGEISLDSYLRHNGDTDTFFGFSGNDEIKFRTTGIDRLLINFSGNVGIGTTTPDSRIHAFVSSGSIQTLLKLENGSATASSGTKISFTEGGAERAAIISQINTGTTPYLSFENNGAERMRITSAGNILSGINTPRTNFNIAVNSKFQLEGLSFDDCNYSAVRNSNDAGSTSLKFGKTRGTAVLSNTIVQNGDFLGLIEFQGADGSNLIKGSEIRGFVDGTPSLNTMPGGLSFWTNGVGNTTTERMRITSSGLVGIGTSSPTVGLQVDTGSDSRIRLSNSGTVVSEFRGTSTLTSLSAVAAIPLAFNTNGSERLRITSGGNVLIGTTTDNGARLQVSGTSTFTSDVSIGTTETFAIHSVYGNTKTVQFIYHNGVNDNAGIAIRHNKANISGETAKMMEFYTSGTNKVGSITSTLSATAYNTSSDYRLKTDLKDYNGLDLVNKIKTYDFAWKTDKSRAFGVVAHELQDVINYAVTGQKDGIEMQGVDYSKLVPIMVKAIQELKQEIDTLKN